MPTIATHPTEDSADVSHRAVCRIGYAAHGVVYLLLGVLAIDAAVVSGDRAEGTSDAVAQIGRGTIGTILLTVLACGLFAYSYLRMWQGVMNPEGHSHDVRGIGTRIGRVIGGLAAAGIGLYALSLAYSFIPGTGGGSEGGRVRDATAVILSMPLGQWIVGAVGIGVCLAAFAQLGEAIRTSFMEELAAPAGHRVWIKPVGRAAYAARFIVYLVVGGFVIVAAYRAEPGQARGLGGALRTLQEQPYGPWLLAATGAGLCAFAVLRGVFARFAVITRHHESRGR